MSINRRKFLQTSGVFTVGALLPVSQLIAAVESKNPKESGIQFWSVKDDMLNDLRRNGYSLIPAPQQSTLSGENIVVDKNWTITTQIGKGDRALKRLHDGALELHGFKFAKTGNNKIILDIKPDSIKEEIDSELAKQGYRLEIAPGLVKISANAEAGLFYGVQSLLQLLRPFMDSFNLPEGTITDWPDLHLRFIHWDTKHHQDRLETMKRYLDWAALFKVNAVAFEIYDKYEFPRHPIIGAPGAFTKVEMQELTLYAHDRFIQLVPDVQAPSHMAYVLKYQEFAHLRADGNNYQACMCDEEAMELIFDMYQDMIDATPGVDYFLVSTDEVYYAGICEKCKKEYNEVNRSQAWVDYVNRVHEWMTKRGRRVIAWVEYPLLAEHIHQLPSGLIDGALGSGSYGNKEWVDNENKAGIKQLAYISMQGGEELFPNYFAQTYQESQNDAPAKGRLEEAAIAIPNILTNGPRLEGTFAAAWDDSGLHNETFWLGWITVMQYGWSIGKPSIEQSVADFMDVFYGYGSPDMIEAYHLLDEGARFYGGMWEHVISTEVKRSYGNSNGKGIGGIRYDRTLEPPSLPAADDINVKPGFREKNAQKIEKAGSMVKDNEKLINLLVQNIAKVKRNRYNLEVLLSIATLQRYSINTMLNLARIEDLMIQASKAQNDHQRVVRYWVNAYNVAGEILKEEESMWPGLVTVWETSQFKRNRSVNGKDFVYVIPDVNGGGDVDRILSLEYMLAPFRRIGIKKWQTQLETVIKNFAKARDIDVKGLE